MPLFKSFFARGCSGSLSNRRSEPTTVWPRLIMNPAIAETPLPPIPEKNIFKESAAIDNDLQAFLLPHGPSLCLCLFDIFESADQGPVKNLCLSRAFFAYFVFQNERLISVFFELVGSRLRVFFIFKIACLD